MKRSFYKIVEIADGLEQEYEEDKASEWVNSPFKWIRGLASRRKGKVGEEIIAQWLTAEGLETGSSEGTGSDIMVNGVHVEVKMSMRWVSGTYRFQQIRDQNYDLLICLGLSPSEAHCWVLPKALLLERVIGQGRGQHGGAGAAETAWLTVDPKSPEAWLRPRYGNLDEAVALIRQLTA